MPTGQTTTANITPKALSVSGITASNKIYDSNAVATLDTTSLIYNGIVAGDDFTGTYTGTFNNKNVGTGKTVDYTNIFGADVGNYSITNHPTITANIITKTLTATASASRYTMQLIVQHLL